MSNSDINFKVKFIRDPLYGFIGLTETEIKIINTKVFRRLHNIKQLSHTYLVYPSAIHTRYEHSLGVVYLADRISDQLGFSSEQKEIIRLAGLLHDIGHGPFSHLFESILKDVNDNEISHDKISMMFIKEDPEISEILNKSQITKIIQLLSKISIDGWDDKSLSSLATDIIAGPLDADKMDYLRRDSYHIGVKYGEFDLHRLIHTLTHTKDLKQKSIAVKFKGIDAVESYRLGRYLMHTQVYNHHTRLIADQMFLRALNLAINEDHVINKKDLIIDTDLSKSHKKFLEYYITLDDRSIYDMILKKPETKSTKILKKIIKRDLLKRIWQINPHNIQNAQNRNRLTSDEELNNIETEIIEKNHMEKHEIIIYISKIQVALYNNEIMIMHDNIPRYMDNLSPIQTDIKTRDKLYIFGDRTKQEFVKEYMLENYTIESELIK